MNVTSISANSISLSWSVPSDSAETSSEVAWQVGSSNSSSSETVMTSGNLSDTNYTIEQLESATIYIITIIVFNAAGSIDSPPIIVSTSQSIIHSSTSTSRNRARMGVPNAAFVHLTTSEIRTPPYYPLGNLFDPMLSRVVLDNFITFSLHSS